MYSSRVRSSRCCSRDRLRSSSAAFVFAVACPYLTILGWFPAAHGLLLTDARAARDLRSNAPKQLHAEHDTDQRASTEGNWCTGDCTTRFEKEYLLNNSAHLEAGLRALRTNGCVPTGRKIIVGGYFRTGSTLLYNQVRLWMELAFPGKVGVGFNPPDKEFNTPGLQAVISKQHWTNLQRAKDANVLVMSRRAVVDSLTSRVDLHYDSTNVDDVLNGLDLETVKRECKVLMLQQAGAYAMWKHVGKKVAYDALLGDFQKNPKNVVKNVARSLGICGEAAKNPQLQQFIIDMASHLRDSPGDAPVLTQMHKEHEVTRKASLAPKVTAFIEQDPRCHAWATKDALAAANPEVDGIIVDEFGNTRSDEDGH